MNTIQAFCADLEAICKKHGIDHALLYAANVQDSFEYRKGFTPEAAHGVLISLTQTYALRSDNIARERAGAKPSFAVVPQ